LVWYGVSAKGGHATTSELREGGRERAREMAAAGLDCLVANGEPHARMLHEATSTVPIVVIVPDPVVSGFAKSLARPGGNMTGLHYGQEEVALKTAELLRRMVPATTCMAWIGIENFRPTAVHLEDAARRLGLRFRALSLKGEGPTEVARVREEMATLRRQGCFTVVAEPPGREFTEVMAALAIEHRLAVSGPAYRDGFLLAYNPLRLADQEDGLRIASLVSRILRGEKPGDIPFEGPSGYRLEVNLKTAARIGVTVPVDILTLADELIR
jgi:putative ABC transport system substrate-binding protein